MVHRLKYGDAKAQDRIMEVVSAGPILLDRLKIICGFTWSKLVHELTLLELFSRIHQLPQKEGGKFIALQEDVAHHHRGETKMTSTPFTQAQLDLLKHGQNIFTKYGRKEFTDWLLFETTEEIVTANVLVVRELVGMGLMDRTFYGAAAFGGSDYHFPDQALDLDLDSIVPVEGPDAYDHFMEAVRPLKETCDGEAMAYSNIF